MFTLDQVVPWGRSFEEYGRMFRMHDAAVRALVQAGCDVFIADVPYEFQRGGNQMMRVRSRES